MIEERGVEGMSGATAVEEQIVEELEALCAVNVAAVWGGAVAEHRLSDGVKAVDQQLPPPVAICSEGSRERRQEEGKREGYRQPRP
jgi:hypothetical protein